MDIGEFLNRLDGVQPTGSGWRARCPAHDDKSPSLSVSTGEDGRILLYCHAGCSPESVVASRNLQMTDLFPAAWLTPRQHGANSLAGGRRLPTTAVDPATGLTLAVYAATKKLPENFLRGLGVHDVRRSGRPAVRIPYLGPSGEELAARLRCLIEGPNRFRWDRKGTKLLPYGLNRLGEARAAGYLVLVEGETDAQTLWLHGIPALGLPGASAWQEAWADFLEGIPRIYVVLEPDAGGLVMQERLGGSRIRDRIHLVRLEGAKDPSALYLDDPDGFLARWAAACEAATPWAEHARAETATKAKVAWQKCESLAREARILDTFAETLARCGVAGEERIVKLLYLQLTSRLMDSPISMVIKGPSAAGKSYVSRQVVRFFPASAYVELTAMSERALVYFEAPLAHRILVLYEAAGLTSDLANYLVRSLVSEGRLRYQTNVPTPHGWQPRLIEREGPTGLLLTTTAVTLHPENETRMLSVPITDSAEQTRQIMRSLAKEHKEVVDLTIWHALQDWLTHVARDVTIPYRDVLAEAIPAAGTRLRRDFGLLLQLIRTHAFLQQASRDVAEDGSIVARVEDYEEVRTLVAPLISEGVEATVNPIVRQTVEAVRTLLENRPQQGAEQGITLKAVAGVLKLDKATVLRRVKLTIHEGYLRNSEPKHRPYRLELGDPLPEETNLLPALSQLGGWAVGDTSGGTPQLSSVADRPLTPEEIEDFLSSPHPQSESPG